MSAHQSSLPAGKVALPFHRAQLPALKMQIEQWKYEEWMNNDAIFGRETRALYNIVQQAVQRLYTKQLHNSCPSMIRKGRLTQRLPKLSVIELSKEVTLQSGEPFCLDPSPTAS